MSKKVQNLVGIARHGGGWIQEPQNDLRIKEAVAAMLGVRVYIKLRDDLDKVTKREEVRFERHLDEIAKTGEATFTAGRRPKNYGGNFRGMEYQSVKIGNEPLNVDAMFACSMISRYPELLCECDIDVYNARKAIEKGNKAKEEEAEESSDSEESKEESGPDSSEPKKRRRIPRAKR